MNPYLLSRSDVFTVAKLTENKIGLTPDLQTDVDLSDCACSPPPPSSSENLLDYIDRSFSLSEFRVFCFRLGINYEDLAGETLTDKAQKLLEHHARRERLSVFLEELHAK